MKKNPKQLIKVFKRQEKKYCWSCGQKLEKYEMGIFNETTGDLAVGLKCMNQRCRIGRRNLEENMPCRKLFGIL